MILLYNVKNNAYIHFSKDQPNTPDYTETKSLDMPSTYRPKSPHRRRNPETIFTWFESNVSQNFEKWTIVAYRQQEELILEDFFLHGGDVIRLRHSETGGFITIDGQCKKKNKILEAYVRVYKGTEEEENTTTN